MKMPYLFKTKPFRHQEEILDLSWKRKYYALFMEMGLGKSKVIIDTIGKHHKSIETHMAGTLNTNWGFGKGNKIKVYKSNETKKQHETKKQNET